MVFSDIKMSWSLYVCCLYSQVLGPGCPLELAHQPRDHGAVALDLGQSLLPQPEHVVVNPLPQQTVGAQGLEPGHRLQVQLLYRLRLHHHQTLINLRNERSLMWIELNISELLHNDS